MRQADVHEKAVRQLTNGMNLADIKIYADADGEVQAVLLKYIDPRYGREKAPKDWDPHTSAPSGGPEPLSGYVRARYGDGIA